MKAIILAGGFGTRLSEKTKDYPKPMIEIGGKPILWHIMMIYSQFGINEFIIALGYKAEIVKQYFLDYFSVNNDLTINLKTGEKIVHNIQDMNWKIHLVDTGLHTMTGGRLKRLKKWIGNETFLFTYGDGLADVNIDELLSFHKSHGKMATVTAVRPPARFGGIDFEGDFVSKFTEKSQAKEGWINGGFFVLEPEVINYIKDDSTSWESEPLERLAEEKQLLAFRHFGFWQPMDTLREHKQLEKLWEDGKAPWKLWDEKNKAALNEMLTKRLKTKK
jgi:glucose-1-phosphate cytidylyltransferase